MKNSFRVKLIFFAFLFFGSGILLRLFYWQFLVGDKLALAAESQRFGYQQLLAQRGKILAADGFPLATNEAAYLVYAAPAEMEADPNVVAQVLAPFLVAEDASLSALSASPSASPSQEELLDQKISFLKEKLALSKAYWLPLQHRVSRTTKEKIAAFGFKGIGFETETKRIYPEGTASAHLLGFVGQDKDGRDKGYFGLEGFYDLELKGRPGWLKRENDASGQPIIFGALEKEAKRDGRVLTTSLDRTIQLILAEKLQEGLERFGAASASAVIMEPSTGSLLGMVSLPSYEPGIYFNFPEYRFLNPAVSSVYEPGSTFKVFIMAAGLDTGVVKPETKCTQCAGPRSISGYSINTWNDKYYPDSTMTEVLVHSDNVGMVFLSEKLGRENFVRYLEKFGFGKLTGVDLQGETAAVLRPVKEWRPLDLATASFGQGIAVTPLQMVQAMSAIANGGERVTPRLVTKINDQGREEEFKPGKKTRVISSQTAEQMTRMLIAAVDDGEAKWAKPAGFSIAGKTGTAQIPVAGHYDAEKTIASFIGFAPAQNPRFVMLVTLREPTSSPWGSETAAPLWFEIAGELFTYFGIPPGGSNAIIKKTDG